MSQPYVPPSPKPPLTFDINPSGDTVTVTDVDKVVYTYLYKPTCPAGYHLVWTGAILICWPD
jgi:hypothetical protein